MSLSKSQLRARFRSEFPDRDWNQKCEAAVAWAAQWTSGKTVWYASARKAIEAAHIASKDAAAAPVGARHFWRIGTFDHIAFGLGGAHVVMASRHVDIAWAENLGETTVGRYSARTGAKYLGWAKPEGAVVIAITVPKRKPKPAAKQTQVQQVARFLNHELGGLDSTAARDSRRGPIYWTQVQTWGARHDAKGRKVPRSRALYPVGYRIDGEPGSRSRKVEDVLEKLVA